jgi:RNA polymerase sigma-70 factor (ECF subfamily)
VRPDDLVDRNLVARSLAGDRRAFGAIVRRHQQVVFGIAYRASGDREVAAELAQEAFLRAHQALGSFDPERPFSPWLYRIATNLSLNWIARRRVETVALSEESTPRAAHRATPEDRVLELERAAIVETAIESLPADFREVIRLRHGEELSYQEIADRLGIPTSSVKSRLFRGRNVLKTLLCEVDAGQLRK